MGSMKKRIVCLAGLFVTVGFLLGAETEEKKKEDVFAPKIRTVVLKSGINLIGTWFEPRDKNSATFVLLHGLGSTRQEWRGFAERLHALGYGVFIYDARGHGESISDTDGNIINYKTFSQWGKKSPWKLMSDDLDGVLLYLEKLEGADKNMFVLGGASLGANVALECAARRKNIKGLMLLSPGLDYAGVTTEYPMRFCKVPALAIAASKGDRYAYQSAKKLISFKRNKKSITFFDMDGSEHGVNMFRLGLDAELLDWILKKIK